MEGRSLYKGRRAKRERHDRSVGLKHQQMEEGGDFKGV